MSILSTRWFSEQEIEENSIIQQFHMNSIVGEVQEAQYIFPHSFTTNNDPSYDDLIEMKPPKILETTYISPSSHLPPNSKPHHIHHHSSSRILSFEDYGSNDMEHEYSPTYLNSIFSQQVEAQVPPHQKCEEFNRKGTKRAQPFSRNQSNAQDHIIAEGKRREKLTQRFVALSALVPGLKKMDKASVLGDALKHIKYLQERVRELEEQKKERRLESMVLVKKSKLILDDNNQSFSSSGEDGFSDLDLPEIEKESDFDMTLMDVVKSLRSALSNFI